MAAIVGPDVIFDLRGICMTADLIIPLDSVSDFAAGMLDIPRNLDEFAFARDAGMSGAGVRFRIGALAVFRTLTSIFLVGERSGISSLQPYFRKYTASKR